jgi:hypothetical protein
MHNLKWIVSLQAENEVVGDGIFFTELAKTLRGYAELLDSGKCGQAPCETFVSDGGTRLTVIAECYSGQPIRV